MAPTKDLAVTRSASSALVSIDPEQTLKASKALLSHIKKAALAPDSATTKLNLLADSDDEAAETPIWLTLTTKRHIADRARLQPGKIALPHPLVSPDAEGLTVCLIVADPQRAYKNLVASDAFPENLRRRVTRVVDLGKLKAKFGQYEAQRKLFAEHDVFLADDRVINRLPKVLGKTFYKTTQKRPIPVVLAAKRPKVDGKRVKRQKGGDAAELNAGTPEEIAKEITKALGAALVSLSPTTNTAVRVGWSAWTPEQIADNVAVVVTKLVDVWVPQKWRNVRSIHIKGPRTAALPIWMTDELWVDAEKDVVADDEETKTLKEAGEKDGAGKKRKAKDAEEEGAAKKVKKQGKEKKSKVPDGDDDKLNKQIADRKAQLKKQKATAKKAMDA